MTTDIDVYQQPAGIGQYQAGIVMTPESAKALDEQVRLCTEAVLREGTDYGIIPGTNGEKTLWRPGAQKLLQWFRLECTCDRIEIERDDDGRKHGITYRAEVGRGLKTATPVILATCEGTADYDESKFHQTAEEVRRKAEARERKFAKIDGRSPSPAKWTGLPEYRADWNALMKRAQKRAIVGAVNDATAAGGIFSDREEDDPPVIQDDGPTWYEQALEDALSFTDQEAGRALFVGAAQAARDGLCTPRQATHIQNRITQRARKLKTAVPVDVEDLAKAAQDSPQTVRGKAAGDGGPAPDPAGAGQPLPPPPGEDEEPPDPTRPAAPAATTTGTGSSTARAADDRSEPGTATPAQLTKLHTILTGLGFGSDERDQKLTIAEAITGRELTGPAEGRTSKNLSHAEARRLIDTLDGLDGDRDALIAYMAARKPDGAP